MQLNSFHHIKMYSCEFFLLFVIFRLFCQGQVTYAVTVSPPRAKNLRDISKLNTIAAPIQTLKISPVSETPLKPILNSFRPERQIQPRDIPFQQPFLGVPVQIKGVHHNNNGKEEATNNLYPTLPKLPQLKPLVKPNETEAERAERIHKSFDRLLTFVEIVGQVDNYVSNKWKNLVKTVSNFYENEEDPYRVNARRIYGPCPHAQ